MEENSSNHLEYLLSIENSHKEYLGPIRHWVNLKIANHEGKTWLRNFSLKQIESIEIKSIPYKQIFSIKDNKLFPYGSILPVSNAPSLLWAPIEIGLPVKLPKLNHNYFGVTETIKIEIVQSDIVHEACALLTSVESLEKYVVSAPAVRLKNLSWVIVNQSKALILGIPLLPIEGDTYWQRKTFFIPTGFDLDMNLLSEVLEEKLKSKSKWLIWDTNGSYFDIEKKCFMPLSISSFRLSFKKE